jgi:hypothetical protein
MASATEQLIEIIDTSLTLTLSGELVSALKVNVDDNTLLKIAIGSTIIMNILPLQNNTLFQVCRKFTVIGTVQIILEVIELGTGFTMFLNVSILIIAACFMTDISKQYTTSAIPEITRLFTSVQWIYADAMGNLFKESSIKWEIVLVGVVCMSQLTRFSEKHTNSPIGIFATSLSMTWINLVVQLVLSERVAISSAFVEIVAVSTLGMLLRTFETVVPALQQMKGYIEWHINNVIIATALQARVSYLDCGIMATVCAVVLHVVKHVFYYHKVIPTSIATLSNLTILVATTAISRYIIERVKIVGGSNDIAFVFIVVLCAQSLRKIYFETQSRSTTMSQKLVRGTV